MGYKQREKLFQFHSNCCDFYEKKTESVIRKNSYKRIDYLISRLFALK